MQKSKTHDGSKPDVKIMKKQIEKEVRRASDRGIRLNPMGIGPYATKP
jgi:hypothetical protein